MTKRRKRISNRVTIGNSKRMKHKGLGSAIKKFFGRKTQNGSQQNSSQQRRKFKITIEE